MRTGFFARTRTKFVELVATAAAVAALPLLASAQPPYEGYASAGRQAPSQPQQALYNAPNGRVAGGQQSAYVDNNGNPMINQPSTATKAAAVAAAVVVTAAVMEAATGVVMVAATVAVPLATMAVLTAACRWAPAAPIHQLGTT